MSRAYEAWLAIAGDVEAKPLVHGAPALEHAQVEALEVAAVAALEGVESAALEAILVPPPTETAAPITMAANSLTGNLAKPETVVVSRDGAYHMWLSTITSHDGFLNTQVPDNAGVLAIWLADLEPEDVLYVYPGSEWGSEEGGGRGVYCVDSYLTILNALVTCRAKVIFVVDRMIAGMMSYMALACKTVVTTDFGHVAFYPTLALRDGARWVAALTPFTRQLYQRGVASKLLSEEEAEALMAMNTVYVGNQELLQRLPPHGAEPTPDQTA